MSVRFLSNLKEKIEGDHRLAMYCRGSRVDCTVDDVVLDFDWITRAATTFVSAYTRTVATTLTSNSQKGLAFLRYKETSI